MTEADLIRENAELKASNAQMREALEQFATGGVVDCLRREDYSVMRERIVDWHGPTDYLKARNAFAETPAASLAAITSPLEARIAELRNLCAEVYQIIGALNGPVSAYDSATVSSLRCGVKR